MEQLNAMAHYQMVVLSQNRYFWLGLQSLVASMTPPRPDVEWLNDVSAETLSRLRYPSHDSKTLLVTERNNLEDLQIFLPLRQVTPIAETCSLQQVQQWLKEGDFPQVSSPAPALTRAEMRVCTLFSQGLNAVRIARVLDKSPKTIYCHKRNVMAKFHCRNLVEFHRTLALLEQKRFYQ